MLTLDELNALIANALQAPTKAGETVALHQAQGRVLDADVISPLNMPVADVSAMTVMPFIMTAQRAWFSSANR